MLLDTHGGERSIISLLAEKHLLLALVHLGEGLIGMHLQLLRPLSVHNVGLAEGRIGR